MASNDSSEYFLGIEGNQEGPFDAKQVVAKIAAGEIDHETLVWTQGMDDWLALKELPEFKSALEGHTPTDDEASQESQTESQISTVQEEVFEPSESEALPQLNEIADEEDQDIEPSIHTLNKAARKKMRAGSSENVLHVKNHNPNQNFNFEPVLDTEESGFGNPILLKYRTHLMAGGLLGVTLLIVGGLAAWAYTLAPDKMDPSVNNIKKIKIDRRAEILSQAESQLLIDPDKSLQLIKKLISSKNDDETGKKAFEAALDYYKREKKFEEIGDLYTMVGKHYLGYQAYLRDINPNYFKAFKAIGQAYQNQTDKAKKVELLAKEIDLLLGPIDNARLALTKIKELVQLSPSVSKKYEYYLQDPSTKIKDIFTRISFYYVDTLSAFIETEFPQIHIDSRPVVELVKQGQDKYRIVGTLVGPAQLSRDTIDNINMTYWLWNGQWYLVETNLTNERQKLAQAQKVKMLGALHSAKSAIRYFEQTFKTQFPERALHESVEPRHISSKK